MPRASVKQLRIAALTSAVLCVAAFAAFAQAKVDPTRTGFAPVTSVTAPPSDADILSVQVSLYALMINRLKADAAQREQEWAEYSKSLWQFPTSLGSR